jgi:hypothetical protein
VQNNEKNQYTRYKDLSKNELLILDFVLGKYYDVIIFVLFVITLVEMSSYLTSSNFNSSLRYATRFFALAFEFFLSWVYLLHFFIVIWIKYHYKHVNYPNFSNTQGLFLLIHFMSGPVAFCLDMY